MNCLTPRASQSSAGSSRALSIVAPTLPTEVAISRGCLNSLGSILRAKLHNMRFDILTLFPGMFTGPLPESITKRPLQAGQTSMVIHDIRACAAVKLHAADGAP